MRIHSVRWHALGRAVLLLAVLLSSGAWACRIFMPPWPLPPWYPRPPMPIPRPPQPPSPMEVREHRARLEIRHQVAEVTVDAVFYNPNPFETEGLYVFPIDPAAAVSSFSVSAGGRTLEAEIVEADRARRLYEDIVRQARDPALLEYAGQGLLRARVFPIPARGEVRIQLTTTQALQRDGGLTRVSYPLLSARPDGQQRLGLARVEMQIETEKTLKSLFTPGFDTRIERDGPRRARLVWEARDYRPDRDLELFYSEDAGPVGVEFMAFRDGDEGYFLMTVAPDSELQAEAMPAKEVTFVIDTSGSMMGEKMRQAREALRFCVEALQPEDRFNIVAFATDVTPLAETPQPATPEQRRQARDFIDGLKARGGTAIDSALQTALRAPAASDRPAMVVLITDGLPTVGETDPGVILSRARQQSGPRRLFAFGVGNDVNTRLLDGLCQGTRGRSSYVRPEQDLEVALSSFYESIAHPVLTGLTLDSGGARLSEINPPELPDLFRGGELRITGTFRGSGSVPMTLSGEIQGRRETFRFTANLDGDRRHAFIPRLWAMARVGYLQDQLRIHGRSQELLDEIGRLGRRFGILTEHTSFLIVEDNIDRARLGEARRAFGQAVQRSAERQSGAEAVGLAVHAKALQDRAQAPGAGGMDMALPEGAAAAPVLEVYEAAGIRSEEVAEMVRTAGEKTFYLRRADQTWYDSRIAAGTQPSIDVEVTAWSDAFFELARRHPELARCLLVGERLVVCLGDRVVRIMP